MVLRLGDVAPDFSAETTEGTINFYDWIDNRWAILFSHPPGLHTCLLDGAGIRREDQALIRQARGAL